MEEHEGMFECVAPNQELPQLEVKDLREFPFLSYVEGDDPTPISYDK